MKIDIHCHTKATVNGDGAGRNVTPEKFREKILAAGVEIVAVTNHNTFDESQFQELCRIVSGEVQVWPGIELYITRSSDSNWHMLLIADPSQYEVFSQKVEQLRCNAGALTNEFVCSFDDAWNMFGEDNVLFIPHCHDKNPAVSEEDIEYIENTTKGSWKVFYEPRTSTTVGIWTNHGRNMVLGSDVKDWDTYEKSRFSELRLPVDSFEQFCLLARRDRNVVETLLNRRNKQIVKASPHKEVYVDIPIFDEINVLFGQKGTGKTEIIRSLEKHFEEQGLTIVSYYGSNKSAEFMSLLSTDNMDRDPAMFERSDCSDAIDYMTEEWNDAQPTSMRKYIDWIETRNSSHNKEKFKIANSSSLPVVSDKEYEALKDDLTVISSFSSSAVSRDLGKYLSGVSKVLFFGLLDVMSRSANDRALKAYTEKQAIKMTNYSIMALKGLLDAKTDTQSKPANTGFLPFVQKRLELGKQLDKLLINLSPKEYTERKYLGKLEEKGDVGIVSRYRYLCADSKKDEFVIGINTLKKIKNCLTEARKALYSTELVVKVSALKDSLQPEQNKSRVINDLSSFIGLKKHIELSETQTEYTPSDGEQGILLLERKLHEDADVFLLDEPESGLSNSYIDIILRPLIQDLAKKRKITVLATHNANLAVRTLPYSSVYREHVRDTTYRTYVGNPFINELVDIADLNNKQSWSERSMSTLEGGSDAFYNRMTIYEAGK